MRNNIEDKLIDCLCVGVIIGIGVLITSSFIDCITNSPHEEIRCENISIVSLHDGLATKGHYCLFSGYIDSEIKYFIYIKNTDGAITLMQIPTDKTKIYEDSETPYISEFSKWSIYPKTPEDNYKHDPWRGYPYYELHVPAGTVIKEYTLNGD